MLVLEVPRPDWEPFCNRFARQHRNEFVSVEKNRRALAEHVRLMGISFADAGARTFVVTVGGPGESFSSYAVLEPARIVLEQSGEDDGGRLRIESHTDDALLLIFSEPVVPGLLGAA